ncbi:ParA family protein [Alistipes indistinctus]|uniref:ParA family protein n=1 Tax=Alistipes indistinctus TaxID=626932 RepID=UPI0015F21C27|nr:ParA family protein [Alistipes indistinctus]BCD55428.1 conjugal transfer protein TraA [Alistipes indistinctus]
MKTSVIAIESMKGGVGKSNLTNILANELAYIFRTDPNYQTEKNKILVLDIDTQSTIYDKRDKDLKILHTNIESDEYKNLPEEQQIYIRTQRRKYAYLQTEHNWFPYDIIDVSPETADKALEIIDSEQYDYVLLDFPGTLEQANTGELFLRINHLIIPTSSTDSDINGLKRFLKYIEDIDFAHLESVHFLFNRYETLKKRKFDEVQQAMEEEYGIEFLKTRIKDSTLADSNSILPLSISINLNNGEIKQAMPCFAEFAYEVIEITQPYK